MDFASLPQVPGAAADDQDMTKHWCTCKPQVDSIGRGLFIRDGLCGIHAKHCTDGHARLKRDERARLEEALFWALDDQEGLMLRELWNCPCGGTFTVQGIGPMLADALPTEND